METYKRDSEGTIVLTAEQYDQLQTEASIAASEAGCNYEADFDYEQWELDFIERELGTDNWIAESGEPDDGYDYDKYY